MEQHWSFWVNLRTLRTSSICSPLNSFLLENHRWNNIVTSSTHYVIWHGTHCSILEKSHSFLLVVPHMGSHRIRPETTIWDCGVPGLRMILLEHIIDDNFKLHEIFLVVLPGLHKLPTDYGTNSKLSNSYSINTFLIKTFTII